METAGESSKHNAQSTKARRHQWQRLRTHVYICTACGCGKVNAQRGGAWYTTYHRPDGTSVVSATVPGGGCVAGPLTEKYLGKYRSVLVKAAAE